MVVDSVPLFRDFHETLVHLTLLFPTLLISSMSPQISSTLVDLVQRALRVRADSWVHAEQSSDFFFSHHLVCNHPVGCKVGIYGAAMFRIEILGERVLRMHPLC